MAFRGSTLAREFLAGRTAAVRQVESWVRMAAGSFRRRLGDDWEDAVQESLLEVAALLRAGRLRNPDRFRAWVFRAATHTCLDRVRAKRRWSWVDADEVELSSPPSALARLLEEGAVERLLELVARCPEHCRRLWEMLLAGLSYREMSARTGLTEGALRVRVLRCRRRAQELAAPRLAEGSGCARTCDRSVTNSQTERRELVEGDDHAL